MLTLGEEDGMVTNIYLVNYEFLIHSFISLKEIITFLIKGLMMIRAVMIWTLLTL